MISVCLIPQKVLVLIDDTGRDWWLIIYLYPNILLDLYNYNKLKYNFYYICTNNARLLADQNVKEPSGYNKLFEIS